MFKLWAIQPQSGKWLDWTCLCVQNDVLDEDQNKIQPFTLPPDIKGMDPELAANEKKEVYSKLI